MKHFSQCGRCEKEYSSSENRRFHAEPNACPECGPHLEYWDHNGNTQAKKGAALLMAIEAIRNGEIIAIKGIGGFHLMADAGNERALLRLRQSKSRATKPFALLYPSLSLAKRDCLISSLEEDLLGSAEAPIVLLRRKKRASPILPQVAPRNPYLGVFLPSNPLHHLLMDALSFPVVATSGNVAEEPICSDEKEALSRLGRIADGFLVHNRPIARSVDDSIVREVKGRPLVLRRSRGLAPYLEKNAVCGDTLLALGGHLKNTIALSFSDQILVSQHIGDLSTDTALHGFEESILDVVSLYDRKPSFVVCDAHPDYVSSRKAEKLALPVIKIQHHYAHVLSCLADNASTPPALGVAWDGSGYGIDGTIWGGEFLKVDGNSFKRFATLFPFRLPGGEAAIRDGRRIALSILFEVRRWLPDFEVCSKALGLSSQELRVFTHMLNEGTQSPVTTSVGRLFDAVAALLGTCPRSSFEGEAACSLEYAAMDCRSSGLYEFALIEEEVIQVDWRAIITSLLEDVKDGVSVPEMASKFHNTLVEIIVQVAKLSNEHKIALTGGCFQNRYLLEQTVTSLEREGFAVLWHKDIPPNDGGLALGQIVAASIKISGETSGRFPCA